MRAMFLKSRSFSLWEWISFIIYGYYSIFIGKEHPYHFPLHSISLISNRKQSGRCCQFRKYHYLSTVLGPMA